MTDALPETVDRRAVNIAVEGEFHIPADRIHSVDFGTVSFPSATVIAKDMEIPIRVCKAAGIPLDGVRAVHFDSDGAIVTTIDGDATRIPFAEEDDT